MKIKIVIILNLVYLSLLSQKKNLDIIIWSDTTKLTWADFTKIDKKPGLPGEAGTTVKFHYKDTCINGRITVLLYTWFSRSKSWVLKTSVGNKELLEHEQLHFDLIELFARMCRFKIALLEKTCTVDNHEAIMNAIAEFDKKQKEANLKYDKETEHYKNKAKQKEWKEKIEREMKDMENYKLNFGW